MTKFITGLLPLLAILFSAPSFARDDVLQFPVDVAMSSPDYQEKLGDDVRFYWGDQGHPRVAQTLGTFPSNKKTNAFNKSDQEACEWALLSALIAFRDRALREGGNAVINIKSTYTDSGFSSSSEYQCGAGAFVAGVSLEATVVKLAQ